MSPVRILHRDGQHHEWRRLAAHPAVDVIETDLWISDSLPCARHDTASRRFPRSLPGLGRRRHVEPVDLEAWLETVHGRACLSLDLRTRRGDPTPDLARALRALSSPRDLSVCCETWEIADRLRAWLPDIDVAYAIRSERQLREYLDARDRDLLPATPVVVQHTLLHTRDEVQVLRRRATRVGAGVVDDTDRAIDLAEWGVDEVTSRHVVVLNAL